MSMIIPFPPSVLLHENSSICMHISTYGCDSLAEHLATPQLHSCVAAINTIPHGTSSGCEQFGYKTRTAWTETPTCRPPCLVLYKEKNEVACMRGVVSINLLARTHRNSAVARTCSLMTRRFTVRLPFELYMTRRCLYIVDRRYE